MSRLIDADALIRRFHDSPTFEMSEFLRTLAIDFVKAAPTIDAVPVVRGKWIEHGRDRPPTCSNCGSGCLLNYESDYHKSDYCPHCGADMMQTGDENV